MEDALSGLEGSRPGRGFEPLSPVSFLLRSARVWEDRLATGGDAQASTYGDLLLHVERAAGALRAAGVGPGDRVAVLLPNVAAMLELHFAIAGIGAILVSLNTRLSARECRIVLQRAQVQLLVAFGDYQDRVEEAVDGWDDAPELWLVASPPGTRSYEERKACADPVEIKAPDERSPLSINYTSGTTGVPKGAVYTHRGAFLHSLGVIAEARMDARSRYLWTLPMFHCNGWAYPWAVTAVGARHVLMESFDPEHAWELIAEYGVTHFCGAPTVMSMLVDAAGASKVDHGVRAFVGGAPPSPSLLRQAEELGISVTHLYGLTESYGPIIVCAWNPDWDALPAADRARLRARQGVETVVSAPFRIVDDGFEDTPADGETVGEVLLRGNNVTLGYFDDPEATDRAFSGDWFHTGDLAVRHPDGYLEIRDRAKDIVISGGENISANEVEQALAEHPGIRESAVVGVPDEKWGEALVAHVLIRDGVDRPDRAELVRFLRGRLAGYKIPRRYVFPDDLPRTATGKIQKFRLRETAKGEEQTVNS